MGGAMIQRIVCFKFIEGARAELIEQHFADFAGLKAQIPQIVDYAGGRMLDTDESSKDYDSLHRVTFAEQADIDVYFHHAAHQAFIERNKGIWDKVIVFDAVVEAGIE